MNPKSWEEMIKLTRELESSLGDGVKIVQKNEVNTVILQRRALCANKRLISGSFINKNDIISLRPIPVNGIPPYKLNQIIGKKLKRDIKQVEYIQWKDQE